MGLTAELVQVALSEQVQSEHVAEAIRRLVREDGSHVEAQADAPDTSTILLLPANDRWVAVLDEGVSEPAKLARNLSQALATVAIEIHVFDSDVLEMVLYRAGKAAGKLAVRPGRKPSLTQPESWGALLRNGTVADLQAAIAARAVFVEDNLKGVAKLLGIDSEYAASVFDDFSGAGPAGLMRLYFRTVMPAAAASGLPAIGEGHPTAPPSIRLGEVLERQFSAMFTNTGGPGVGVRVTLSGSALDEELIAVDSLEFIEFLVDKSGHMTANRRRVPVHGRTVEASEVVLQGAPPMPTSGSVAAVNRAARQTMRRKLGVNLFGRTLACGIGIITVQVAALANLGVEGIVNLRINVVTSK